LSRCRGGWRPSAEMSWGPVGSGGLGVSQEGEAAWPCKRAAAGNRGRPAAAGFDTVSHLVWRVHSRASWYDFPVPPWSIYTSPNHCRNDWATCSASGSVSRPTRLRMSVSCTLYSPRFTAVGTWSPAAAHSARTNSPARREVVRLVSGTMKTSCDTQGHLVFV